MEHSSPALPRRIMAATFLLTPALVWSLTSGAAPLDENLTVPQPEWFSNWEVESRVAKAQLVMVAQLETVSPITVVHGAKADTNLREYRFKPVSVLKGVFTRAELFMTDVDLGLPAPDPGVEAPLKNGAHILLILTRSRRSGVFCCVDLPRGVNEPHQLIPRLSGPDDPVVAMTKTIIRITQLQSQQQRVELGIDALRQLDGPSTVPLLLGIASRGYWIQEKDAIKLLAGLTGHESRAVRNAAVSAVCRVLASRAPLEDGDRNVLAAALQKLLQSKTAPTYLRAEALDGLGYLADYGRRTEWVSTALVDHVQGAGTHTERAAAIAALARLKAHAATDVVLATLQGLPLDEYKTWESKYIDAAVLLAKTNAAPALLNRLQRKLNGGHAALPEIRQLGVLKYHDAIPTLILAAGDGRHGDEITVARAFGAIKDERAVPALAELLKSTNGNTRAAAMQALGAIDSESAVAVIRPRLKSETDLAMKLHMAEFLGRHGIRDGYDLAMEHLADPGMAKTAARTLSAIKDPRTAQQLWKSVEESHDTAWAGAALQGLAALKDPKVQSRLQKILADQRSPLLAAAIAATGTLGDTRLLSAVTPHVRSRNHQIATDSIATIKTLAEATAQQRGAHRDSLEQAGTAMIEVLRNPDIHVNLRIAAIDALQAMKDERFATTLKIMANETVPGNSALQSRLHSALTAL